MKPRALLILSVCALIAIAAGLWIAGRTTSSSAPQTARLYPELEQELESVTAVRIFKAGDERAVEMRRTENGWVLIERNDHPVDEAQLGKLVRALAEAQVVEEKTSNPENYASLGVEDVSKGNAGGVRLELNGGAPVNLIVGNAAPGGGRYVRRADEATSWLISASVEPMDSPQAWLRKDLLDVRADRVQSAVVQTAKQKPYTAEKARRADAAFNVNLPKGKTLRSPNVANTFATALAGVTLNDVRSAKDFSETPEAQATFRTFDGLIVQLDGWARDDKRYLRIDASFDPEQARRFAPPATEPEATDEAVHGEGGAQTKGDASTEVADEAARLDRRVDGWVYEIPSYRYEQIFKPLEQLTE